MGNFMDDRAGKKNNAPSDDGSVLIATETMDQAGKVCRHYPFGEKKNDEREDYIKKGHEIF